MCPISAAAPRPFQALPSSTIPPPTPVPQKTPRIDLYGFPAPSLNSASVATDTSLPRETGTPPTALPSSAASGNGSIQSLRLRALATVPADVSITPGDPTPTDTSEAASTPAAPAASARVAAISEVTAGGPPLVGVGGGGPPTTLPRAFTTPPRRLRPPW